MGCTCHGPADSLQSSVHAAVEHIRREPPALKKSNPDNPDATPAAEDLKLEATVERLEAIVEELESGKADLERSIELFAEGRKLGARALKKLEGLERRVQVVIKGEGEKLELEDFEREDE